MNYSSAPWATSAGSYAAAEAANAAAVPLSGRGFS